MNDVRFEYNILVEDFFDEENGLLKAHWEEVNSEMEKQIPLKPNVEKYIALQELGMLSNVVCYVGDELAGYSVIFSSPHLHHRDDVFSSVDVIFVTPEYRKSRIGPLLIKETERLAMLKGASVLTFHPKTGHGVLEKILHRKGYTSTETTLTKYIKE